MIYEGERRHEHTYVHPRTQHMCRHTGIHIQAHVYISLCTHFVYTSNISKSPLSLFLWNTNFMELKLTKRQLEILRYIEEEHLPSLIKGKRGRTYILDEDLICSLVQRLEKMEVLSVVCTRILGKLPQKKSTPSRGGAHNPPPQIPTPRVGAHTTPLPISAGGYTIFKWSMNKYKDPDAIHKVLTDLNLEVEDGWITCQNSLLKTVTNSLEKILINIGEDFFEELDSVVHTL